MRIRPCLFAPLTLAFLLTVGAHRVDAEDAQPSACGFAGLRLVNIREGEVSALCTGLADVLALFDRMGLFFEPAGVIERATDPGPTGGLRSHGSFDARKIAVRLPFVAEASAWGVHSTALSGSFLRHELVHLAVRLILKDDYARISRPWHEFIAYSLQLQLLPEPLREQILDKYAGTPPFDSLLAVNDIFYNFDPEAFAVAAYKTYLKHGRGHFIRQLLLFEVVPPELLHPPLSPLMPGPIGGR